MRVTFVRAANAAYLSLVPIGQGEAVRQEVSDSGIILDFDRQNRRIGIEVLGATKRLPQQVRDGAERL